jgi:spermidine/putrescine ABC transporter ATP-binding subunit
VQAGGLGVKIEALTLRYGNFVAVDNVSIVVEPGEFLALLGPSGSGKTSILMSIAGFAKVSDGRIEIGRNDVTRLPPRERNIGMVFQKYALFPHMTVAQNIAFPLIQRGVHRDEIARSVDEFIELVGLQGFENRIVPNLSGGQQQRVALARALVYRPPVLLMDEPLGALDKKLRERLQVEIKAIQKVTGTTVIFVTHDQVEALNMADRVVVLNHGRIEQAGTPVEVYERPGNTFVADFIGEANVLSGTLDSCQGSHGVLKGAHGQALPGVLIESGAPLRPGTAADIVIRPYKLRFTDERAQAFCFGKVANVAYSGDSIATHVALAEGGHVTVREAFAAPRPIGTDVAITWHPADAKIFHKTTNRKGGNRDEE